MSLVITNADQLPAGDVGIPYLYTFLATGGNPPYRWSTDPDNLPAGLALDPVSGNLTGTPTTPTLGSALITVSDSSRTPQTTNAYAAFHTL